MSIVGFMGVPDSSDGVAMVAEVSCSWIYIQPPATAAISSVASASQWSRDARFRATTAQPLRQGFHSAGKLPRGCGSTWLTEERLGSLRPSATDGLRAGCRPHSLAVANDLAYREIDLAPVLVDLEDRRAEREVEHLRAHLDHR